MPALSKDDILRLSTATVEAVATAAKLADDRSRTRGKAIAAMREIEAALAAVLAESGLPAFAGVWNLGTGTVAFRGVNVRSAAPSRALERERPCLVLDAHGRLVMARLTYQGDLAVGWTAATDDDLQVDDLELVAAATRHLLDRHLQGVETRTTHLGRVEDLATNLGIAVDAWESGRLLRERS